MNTEKENEIQKLEKSGQKPSSPDFSPNSNFAKRKAISKLRTPAFWTGILTSIAVAMVADLGFEVDETTVAGLVTAVITFIATRLFKKKIENKKEQK